ncbi:MAG: hypothetical protein HC808_19375 [Candidatus Competibacteraceae bacterium]|nr:hypothetical protein [Candidatus Competibacteraceae bacterium]
MRATNFAAAGMARISGRPLRISIHPADLDLPLAGDLWRHLRDRGLRFDHYSAVFTD